MKFPNKVNEYKDTVLYAMSIIISELAKPKKAKELFTLIGTKATAQNKLDGISCLFALGMVKMNEKGEIYKC